MGQHCSGSYTGLTHSGTAQSATTQCTSLFGSQRHHSQGEGWRDREIWYGERLLQLRHHRGSRHETDPVFFSKCMRLNENKKEYKWCNNLLHVTYPSPFSTHPSNLLATLKLPLYQIFYTFKRNLMRYEVSYAYFTDHIIFYYQCWKLQLCCLIFICGFFYEWWVQKNNIVLKYKP